MTSTNLLTDLHYGCLLAPQSWDHLPVVLLEKILTYLPPKDRCSMSQVCRQWNESFLSASAWHHLYLHQRSFTSKEYNVFCGIHRQLDQKRLRIGLDLIGHHIRKLEIPPLDDYLHLKNLLDALLKLQSERDFLPSLKTLHFTYSCETRNRAGIFLLGIGLPLLKNLLEIIVRTKNISSLTMNNLLLDKEIAENFLVDLADQFAHITMLELRNCTSESYALLQVDQFKNLETFITSPQQINERLVLHLAENKLKCLHIVQDKYTSYAAPLSRSHWSRIRHIAPELRVKLLCTGLYKHDVLLQMGAPVSTVVYDTPHSVISPVTIWGIGDFSQTLTTYGHKGLPKIHGRQVIHDRADSLLLLLIDNCLNLETLIIRDRISTASILLMARKCLKLKKFFVRRNSVLKRLDWSQMVEWSDDFFLWLKKSSKSITGMEVEVSKILGYNWTTLSDGEFSQLSDLGI